MKLQNLWIVPAPGGSFLRLAFVLVGLAAGSLALPVVRAGDPPADPVAAQRRAAVREMDGLIRANPTAISAYHQRGVLQFQLGEMAGAIRDFDQVIKLAPDRAPDYWQRGIALYYAGRYADGRKQFELHQTVNPNDVENAAWHFLCVAKQESPAAARKVLIPIHGDGRVPMMKILDLFAGKATSDDVLREAAKGKPSPEELRSRLFFAHLYLGLFAAANGDAAGERDHIQKSVTEFSEPHYMGDVARVHWAILQAAAAKPKP